jgi:fluoride ion exporter CrcB/FEX
VRLAEEGRARRAAAYAVVSPAVGLAALLIGLAVA